MGKAKRFNAYDAEVAEGRKLVQAYGQARQNLSGISSTFRSPGLPPIITLSGITNGTGTGKFLTASLAADQTANIAAANHIEFDTKDEDGGVVLQTGSGQSDGLFELGAGTTYQLSAHLRPEFSGATGNLEITWRDQTNTTDIGSRAIYQAQTHSSHNANQPVCEAIITPATNILVKVEIKAVTALTALANEYCVANLYEIALGGTGSGSGGSSSGGVTFPITPTINDHGNVGTVTEDIDISASTGHVHKLTLTGNPTLTFSNPPSSGTQMEFEIEFVQDGTGNRTVTHPSSVAETVSISPKASATTIITYRVNDGGTVYHAIPALRGSISLSAGSFANVGLDNLASVSINADLDPDSGSTRDLGDGTNDWANIFVDDVRIQAGGTGVGGARQIYGDADGVTINTPDTKKIIFDFNNVEKFDMSSTSFTAPNIIVSTTLTINDGSGDPGANGIFKRNGDDVKVFSGGSVRNLSNLTATAPATAALDNLASVAINTSLISDTDGTDDLGTSTISWKDLWIDEVRFGNATTATAGGINIAKEALTPDTMVLNVGTNEDFIFAENGDASATAYLVKIDTSAGSFTIGDASGNLTILKMGGSGGGSIFSILKATTNQATFSSSDGFLFELGSIDTDSNDIIIDDDGDTTIGDGGVDDQFQISTGGSARAVVSNTGFLFNVNINMSSADIDLQGNSLVLDADADSTISSSSDDNIQFATGGNVRLAISNTSIISDLDLAIGSGTKIKAATGTEIGIQVNNNSYTVGSLGSIVIPTKNATVPSGAAAIDSDFGDEPGCIGCYINTTLNTSSIVIRQGDGGWSGVAMVHDLET